MIMVKNRLSVLLSLYADAPSSRVFTLTQNGEQIAQVTGGDGAVCIEAIAGVPINVSATGEGGGPSSFKMNIVAPAPTLAVGAVTYPYYAVAEFAVGEDPVPFTVCDSVGLLIST